jgi:hypothetical protein
VIGFVRQHGAGTVVPSLTVFENLYYRACLFASKKDGVLEIHKDCASLLDRLGLANRRDVLVSARGETADAVIFSSTHTSYPHTQPFIGTSLLVMYIHLFIL